MARRRRSSNRVQSTRESAITPLSLSPMLSPVRSALASPVLSSFDDGRFWHPDPEHGAVTIGGRWARVTVHDRPIVARSQALRRWGFGGRGIPVGLQVPVGLKFEHPFRVMTCVRRKVRRAVLFARNKAGKGGPKGRYRRTWKSEVWC